MKRADRRALLERRRDARAVEAERSCGTCTACCTTHRIAELNKPDGAACAFLRPEDEPGAGRCGRYASRPADCVAWSCVWRRGGLEPSERPDRVGVVVDVAGENPEVLELAEAIPGGLERPEARRLRARLEGLCEVVVKPLPADGRRHLPLATST